MHLLVVSPITGKRLRFPVCNNFIRAFEGEKESDESVVDTSTSSSAGALSPHCHCIDSLRQIANSLPLGKNRARFLLLEQHGDIDNGNDEPMIVGIAPFHIFVWSSTSIDIPALVVVDIDGTVTRTNKRGFWHTAIMHDFSHTHCHSGVCSLLQSIPSSNNKNKNVVYVTTRPLSYADATRQFLESLREGSHGLPPGPILGYGGTMASVLRMDHWDRNPHVVKYDMLERNVLRPFRDLGVATPSLLEAGFGNTLNDMHAYHKAGIALHRLFLVDKQSRISCLDRNFRTTILSDGSKTYSSSINGVNGCENYRALDHPNDYAMEVGTLFQRGYEDERLWRYILGYHKS